MSIRDRLRPLRAALNSAASSVDPSSLDLVGEIDGELFVPVPKVSDPEFGTSSGLPGVLEIRVDVDSEALGGVGRLVKSRLFPEHPFFLFNVCFACADYGLGRPSPYVNPRSPWFNVFFGYYEIDVPKRYWKRPFGYQFDGDGAAAPHWDDLVRIGKADWNYFSNYLYGVPQEVCAANDEIDVTGSKPLYHGRQAVGARHWDLVELGHVPVVSGYTSDPSLLQDPSPLSSVWRRVFGPPHPRERHPEAFPTTPMRGKFYMSYLEEFDEDLGEDAFKTFMFGGTINTGFFNAPKNERFLELQLDAVRKVMRNTYEHLGFEA